MMKFLFPLFVLSCVVSLPAADYDWCAIGNSFSFRNSLYQTVQHFIANDGSGETTRFAREFMAGAAAQEHWLFDADMIDIRRIHRNSTIAFTKKGEVSTMLENGPWNWFIVQHYPSLDDDPSPLRLRPEATRRWKERVNRIDADIRIAIYATPIAVQSDVNDYIQEQQKLNALNRRMAQAMGLGLVPCGQAWVRVFQDRPEYWTDRVLHAEDNFHPDDAGTYLNACVFYAYFTGRSPVGLPWNFYIDHPNEMGQGNFNTELNADLALYLQQKAWETVQADAIHPPAL